MLREIYLSGMRLTLALFSIVGGALIVFARPFLEAWVPQYAASANIVVLLTVAALLEALISPVSQALQGMSRHRPLVIFAEAAIVLPFGARVLDVRAADVARSVLLPGVLPLIPMVAVLALIHAAIAPSTIPAIVLSGLAGAVVYSAGYLVFPATASERALVRRLLALGRGALSR